MKLPAVLIVTLPLVAWGACGLHMTAWERGAHQAVREAVASLSEQRSPNDVEVAVTSDLRRAFVGLEPDYEIEGADNFLAGTSLIDIISPGVWVAHLRFSDGSVYHAEAFRAAGKWSVLIQSSES